MDQEPSVEALVEDPGIDTAELLGIISPQVRGPVEVVLADPGCMRILNRDYRHVDRPTDVLTFDLSEGGEGPEGVIYVDARLNPPLEALLERIFHGYLHLAGMRHDTPDEHEAMDARVAGMVAAATEAVSR